MRVAAVLAATLGALALTAPAAHVPSRTRAAPPSFISVAPNGEFMKDGQPFRFVGTNVYWLPTLLHDDDIRLTLKNISSHGIKVVRTWAFNDVTEIPQDGVWFQLIANGSVSVNTEPNGLQRLDSVVKIAEEEGIFLILSLTNNWNPRPEVDNTPVVAVQGNVRRDATLGTGNNLPRNFLSNDFGGMDAYVREFGVQRSHDEFYLNDTIINIFNNYTTQVLSRYKNSPAILSYELANDARCNSSIPASQICNTKSITSWHETVSAHVKSIDPNHIISSGVQGFLCTIDDPARCPKLNPTATPTPPAPAPSLAAAASKRKKRSAQLLTSNNILRERAQRRKVSRDLKKRDLLKEGKGMMIRGRWITTRQASPADMGGMGSALDGSFGVDSQDILNIGNIGFGTFQLFPDLNTYEPPDPNLPQFNNTVNAGILWIQQQAQVAQMSGKPTVLTAFGLVTQDNAPFFVPFNETTAPFNGTATDAATTGGIAGLPLVGQAVASPFGVSQAQQADAYQQWLSAAASAGVSGALQYQWGQGGLTTQPGTNIEPNIGSTDAVPNAFSSSPNDGFRSAPTGTDQSIQVLGGAASSFI